MKLFRNFLALAILALTAALFTADDAPGYAGDEACLTCHDDVGASSSELWHQKHFRAGARNTCEACHGPGSAHAEGGDATLILSYKDDAEQSKKFDRNCLSCHHSVMHGLKGDHLQTYGLTCNSCHKVHQPAGLGTLVKDEKELCDSCHPAIRSKSLMPSHHPMREGRMACTSCHNMEGDAVVDIDRPNDLCLSCHAQYRGPFVFEHAPVVESCSICHDPHGSVANNLLKQNEPFLCLQCHQMHFHTQKPGDDAVYDNPYTGRTVVSNASATRRGLLTRCTQCHQPIHGSDLPSQEISSQGKALTR